MDGPNNDSDKDGRRGSPHKLPERTGTADSDIGVGASKADRAKTTQPGCSEKPTEEAPAESTACKTADHTNADMQEHNLKGAGSSNGAAPADTVRGEVSGKKDRKAASKQKDGPPEDTALHSANTEDDIGEDAILAKLAAEDEYILPEKKRQHLDEYVKQLKQRQLHGGADSRPSSAWMDYFVGVPWEPAPNTPVTPAPCTTAKGASPVRPASSQKQSATGRFQQHKLKTTAEAFRKGRRHPGESLREQVRSEISALEQAVTAYTARSTSSSVADVIREDRLSEQPSAHRLPVLDRLQGCERHGHVNKTRVVLGRRRAHSAPLVSSCLGVSAESSSSEAMKKRRHQLALLRSQATKHADKQADTPKRAEGLKVEWSCLNKSSSSVNSRPACSTPQAGYAHYILDTRPPVKKKKERGRPAPSTPSSTETMSPSSAYSAGVCSSRVNSQHSHWQAWPASPRHESDKSPTYKTVQISVVRPHQGDAQSGGGQTLGQDLAVPMLFDLRSDANPDDVSEYTPGVPNSTPRRRLRTQPPNTTAYLSPWPRTGHRP